MNAVLTPYDPLISEFQTAKQERAYTAWVNAKVEKSLDDPRPNVPHDAALSQMRKLLDTPKLHAAD